MNTTRTALLAIAALTLSAAPALADANDLLTLGVGAQFSYVPTPGTEAASDVTANHQYGVLSRVKVLRFLGVEFAAQLDQDPKTQPLRHLSPRYQLGAMLNLVPTDHFNLFAVAGLAAHEMGDLVDLAGRTTSLHAGPGLEIYLSEHVAFGADLRWRVPGPEYLKARVRDELSTEPVDQLVGFEVWQANFNLTYYL